MFVDASAMVAMMTDEDDARALAGRMQEAGKRMTSPESVWEVAVSVARILGIEIAAAGDAVQTFLKAMSISIMATPPNAAFIALEAFDRFGKGRHRAALNFGDCMSYACARCYQAPLLFKGDDFTHTDIEPA
jgi:ribonuclease VapC